MLKIATIVATVALMAGCASTDSKTASDRSDIKNAEVRTGTRLPPRGTGGVAVISGQEYKQDSMNRTTGDTPRAN